MSSESPSYKKGACTTCGGHIEFPAEALGMTIPCPHCATQTKLLDNLAGPAAPKPAATDPVAKEKPAPKAAKEAKFSRECPGCGLEVSVLADACPGCGAVLRERSRFSAKLILTSLLGLAVVAGGVYWATGGKLKLPKFKLPEFAKRSAAEPAKKDGEPAPATPAPPPRPIKRSNVFKVVDYQIERTPGRSLVYVVGSVTNDTDKQQFSVRVKFDLADRGGKSVGEATDYIAVIEPGNGWEFKALILDTNAATAKLQVLEVDKQ